MHGSLWIALSSCRIISIFCCRSEATGRRGRRPLQMRMAGRSRTARMMEIRLVCAGRFVNRPYDGNVRFSPHRYPRQDRRLPGGASPSPTTGRIVGFREGQAPPLRSGGQVSTKALPGRMSDAGTPRTPSPTESPSRLLLAEGERIRDHSDELRIGGFSLDIANRIPEILLQHLDIAAIPGHLDGVADFGTFVPKK